MTYDFGIRPARPEHGYPGRHHSNLEVVFLFESVHHFLQRRITPEVEAVPECPSILAVLYAKRPKLVSNKDRSENTTDLLLGRFNGIGETKEWKGQVDESITIIVDFFLLVDHLVQLQADQPGHQTCGGRNSRDDLASNQLGLVLVGGLNIVVESSEVRRGCDEVDVVVRVVVLLELDGIEAIACEGGGDGERGDEGRDVFFDLGCKVHERDELSAVFYGDCSVVHKTYERSPEEHHYRSLES